MALDLSYLPFLLRLYINGRFINPFLSSVKDTTSLSVQSCVDPYSVLGVKSFLEVCNHWPNVSWLLLYDKFEEVKHGVQLTVLDVAFPGTYLYTVLLLSIKVLFQVVND